MMYSEKVNILLVNDNPSALMAMESILSEIDENIVKASSGEEALRQLLLMEFAVIILDVMMPGMDGFETAKIIRQRPQTRHVPIIFTTAYAQTDLDRLKGYELGAADYLFTPIVPEVLRTKVNVFIDLFRTTKTVQQQAINLAEVNQKLYEAHEDMKVICSELTSITSKLEAHVESQSIQFRDAEKRYRSIFENVSEGIFQITPDGSITMANPALISMLGYESFEELTSAVTNVYEQLFVELSAGEEFCQEMTAKGMVHGLEAGIYTKDKGIIWVLIVANTAHEDSSQIHYEGIILDITERKELERKLIDAERAEAASELAAETAHEIRNPLQVIQTGIYLLKKTTDKDNEGIQRTIGQIEHALQRAANFIDELIDISRIPVLNVSRVDILKLLQSVVDEMGIPQAIRVDWDVAVETGLKPVSTMVSVDLERMREVMQNLVKNAVEAMEDQGVLSIQLELEGDWVRITLADTGKGMTVDEVSKMFTPFYSSKRTGKGLGLAVVKRIIDVHEGRIKVESEPGKGTRVVVRLKAGGN